MQMEATDPEWNWPAWIIDRCRSEVDDPSILEQLTGFLTVLGEGLASIPPVEGCDPDVR